MTSNVFQLSSEQGQTLLAELQERGFAIDQEGAWDFRAKKPGLCCTLYSSGKLLVQGKESASFIEFYLAPEILHSFVADSLQYSDIKEELIGSDESGKGDFFGPLCVASFYAPLQDLAHLKKMGVGDSKKLSEKQILKLAKELMAWPHEILILWPKRYNALYERFKNLNRLLAWAHAVCIEKMYQKTGQKKVLIDQFAKGTLLKTLIHHKVPSMEVQEAPRAESLHICVAAASILARASFVLGIQQMEKQLDVHLPKGGGSAVTAAGRLLHQRDPELLRRVCKHHFKNLQQILAQN